MNQLLRRALSEVEALPVAEQVELGQALMDMALRKKLEASLRAAEERGGSTPHAEVIAAFRAKYGR